MHNSSAIRSYLALLALCIIWGTTYFAIKVGVAYFPPFLFSGIRFIIAGGLVLLYFLTNKNTIWPSKLEFMKLQFSGILIFVGGNLFLVLAEQTITSGLAAMANAAFPLWIAIVTLVWNKTEKVGIKRLVGIVIGFLGQFFLFYKELISFNSIAIGSGIFFLIAGVINGAIGSVHMKKNILKSSAILIGGLQMFFAGLITTAIGVMIGETLTAPIPTNGLLSFLYLIFIGSILGYSCFVYAMKHLPATVVSIYAYINPIIALLLGWMFLDEHITFHMIASIAITFIGVYMVTTTSFSRVKDKT